MENNNFEITIIRKDGIFDKGLIQIDNKTMHDYWRMDYDQLVELSNKIDKMIKYIDESEGYHP